jgi:hypothetical protein
MGILDDAIREHLELKRAHGASDDEIRHKEVEVFGAAREAAAQQEAPVAEGGARAPEPVAESPAEAPIAEAPIAEAPIAEAPDAEPATAEPEPAEPEPAEHAAVAPDDPYAVHPGDHAVPDPHHEGEPGGSDPAWGEDTDFFSEPVPQPPAQQQPADHAEERHPALHDTDEHFRPAEDAPEPVFHHREEPEGIAAGGPEAPVSPQAPVEEPEPEPAPVEEPPVEDAPVEGDEDVLEETPEFLQDAPEHDRLWFEQKPPRDFDFGE